MSKQKTKTYPLLYLVICFIIVITSAELMALALNSFEETHRVEAETLPDLPKEIQQNQTTNIIEDGYFKDKPFSFLKKIREIIIPSAYAAEEKYSAQLVSVAPKSSIKIQPGKALTIELKYLNTSTVSWQRDIFNFTAIATADPLMHASAFKHQFWEQPFRPARLVEKKVKPGEIGTFRFAVQAPQKIGQYKEGFILVVRKIAWINNSQTSIEFVVTNNLESDKPVVDFYTPTKEQRENYQKLVEKNKNENRSGLTTPTNDIAAAATTEQLAADDATQPASIVQPVDSTLGPTFRVGLYETTQLLLVTANKNYLVKFSDDSIIIQQKAGESVSAQYDFNTKQYQITTLTNSYMGNKYVIITGQEPDTILEILNYENRLPWNPAVNDNRFRNKLELRLAEKTNKLWVINELPFEQYLMGVAEVSNLSPQEYLKAMAVAVRTYAYYHYNKGMINNLTDASTKHAAEHFYVDSINDQIYRGYGIEERLTSYRQAVKETSGEIAVYQDKVAITPYFSRSDGRTRSFKEVWYNDVPWLISVPTPYDQSNFLHGHGVGMACTDAYRRAENGATYQEILKYYYTGVNLVKKY